MPCRGSTSLTGAGSECLSACGYACMDECVWARDCLCMFVILEVQPRSVGADMGLLWGPVSLGKSVRSCSPNLMGFTLNLDVI